MGFKANRTFYTLEFDGDLAGLEVKLRRGSIRERMEYEALGDWKKQVDALPQFLVSWNVLGDDEQVLPLTAESLWSLEEPTLTAIVNAYTEAVYPSAPLGAPSTDGATESEPAPQPARDLELEDSMQQMTVLAS